MPNGRRLAVKCIAIGIRMRYGWLPVVGKRPGYHDLPTHQGVIGDKHVIFQWLFRRFSFRFA